MSSFTDNVSIQPLPKSNKRITTKWFRYYVWEYWSDEYIDVPVWYEFDWASVPMLFWMFIQRVEPKTLSAACLHDYLYTEWRRYTLQKTDRIFYESLIVSWVNKCKAMIMYIWVILWWWIYWNRFI
jgi:hypothetical protein